MRTSGDLPFAVSEIQLSRTADNTVTHCLSSHETVCDPRSTSESSWASQAPTWELWTQDRERERVLLLDVFVLALVCKHES